MNNNTKFELELSEEQLQAITGGCAQCGADRKFMQEKTTQAGVHNDKATDLEGLGLHNEATAERSAARDLLRQADRVKTQLLIREGNHLLKGESLT